MAQEVQAPAGLSQCHDFMQFENALRASRAIDDLIIQALNNSLPTHSFRQSVDLSRECGNMWSKISSTYAMRERQLQHCIDSTEERVRKAKSDPNASPAEARQATITLRMLRNEQSVEEVIRDRTRKAFHEKCRDHFKPPEMS